MADEPTGRLARALQAIADQLTAAGVPANLEPGAVDTPGAWVTAGNISAATLTGQLVMTADVYLIAGDVGSVAALNLLSGLLDRALAVLTVTVDESTPIETRALVLPHTTTALPALHLTVDDVPVPTD